ncbi:MAG: hypothetical protein SAJ37_16945 [Oscillatoria sp. PMC 1068.18]|nr:hypothetical protein [Oscillatoria sp. PMC 1076.18]MEC4990420.1 hypothetical protein [Oscillatoria sp. PMC 1068.18]
MISSGRAILIPAAAEAERIDRRATIMTVIKGNGAVEGKTSAMNH